MFLGDPVKWFATRKPSGEDDSVGLEKGGPYSPEIVPAYFKLERKLPRENEQHLLDTFHPDLTDSKRQSFREYYKEKKKKSVPKVSGYSDVGIERPRGYHRGVPSQPDRPPEDIASTSYTAEETALANLQIHFSNLYRSMRMAEPYFQKIINAHLLQ